MSDYNKNQPNLVDQIRARIAAQDLGAEHTDLPSFKGVLRENLYGHRATYGGKRLSTLVN